MKTFEIDSVETMALGLLSLYLGKFLKNKFKILNRFGIPAPVLGGLIFSIFHLLLRNFDIYNFSFNTQFLTPFMIIFFTTIGLGSSVKGIKKGGKLLLIFWLLSGFMTFMQTVIGVSLAKFLNINPLLGVLAGSVSMSGGHGSAAAFGKTIDNIGVVGASTIALSAATFGLIAGGLLGAPLATHLIKKFNLEPSQVISKEDTKNYLENNDKRDITVESTLKHITILTILMSFGIICSSIIKNFFNINLPTYIGAMLCAILFNNLNLKFNIFSLDRNLIQIIGEISLNIFLSMALISLKLWELSNLAIPLLIILFTQVIFMWIYTRFFVFYCIGKNFDAAIMIAGMCGSGLGATTNAMINMDEISSKYGFTETPYLIVPLTGAFLIDIFQMPVIITAINIFS